MIKTEGFVPINAASGIYLRDPEILVDITIRADNTITSIMKLGFTNNGVFSNHSNITHDIPVDISTGTQTGSDTVEKTLRDNIEAYLAEWLGTEYDTCDFEVE